jgi:tetratricopeptide (TPR) repeat protein
LFKEVRDKRSQILGPNHLRTLRTLNSLAVAYSKAGELSEAIQLFKDTAKRQTENLGPDHHETLVTLDNLAGTYREIGKIPEAIQLHEVVLDRQRQKLGPDHRETLKTQKSFAVTCHATRQFDRAIELLEDLLQQLIKKLGKNDAETIRAAFNLGVNYRDANRMDEALSIFDQWLPRAEKHLRPGHPAIDYGRGAAAETYRKAGRLPEALQLMEQVWTELKTRPGSDNEDTLTVMNQLAVLYWSTHQLDKSVPLFEQTLQGRLKILSEAHRETIRTAFNLGVNYRDAGRLDDALRIFDDWLVRAASALPPEHSVRQFGRSAGVKTYATAGKHDKAESLLRETANVAKHQSGADSMEYAQELAVLALNLLTQRKWSDAESVLRQCLAIHEQKFPDEWFTFHGQSILGAALMGQNKYAEAEPLLLSAYEGMKKREAMIPKDGKLRLTEALDRVVQLYDAWCKKDKADEWRKKREEEKRDSGVSKQDAVKESK